MLFLWKPFFEVAWLVIHVLCDWYCLFQITLFHFEDEPRPGVAEVISTLRDKAKLRIMMLTGDHESSAWRVAKAVGIDEVYCCLKPEDKLNQVKTASRDRGYSFFFIVIEFFL